MKAIDSYRSRRRSVLDCDSHPWLQSNMTRMIRTNWRSLYRYAPFRIHQPAVCRTSTTVVADQRSSDHDNERQRIEHAIEIHEAQRCGEHQTSSTHPQEQGLRCKQPPPANLSHGRSVRSTKSTDEAGSLATRHRPSFSPSRRFRSCRTTTRLFHKNSVAGNSATPTCR